MSNPALRMVIVVDLRVNCNSRKKRNTCANCILNDILSYGNGANFATLDVFGRLLLNTYFHTIVFLQYCVNKRLASNTLLFLFIKPGYLGVFDINVKTISKEE